MRFYNNLSFIMFFLLCGHTYNTPDNSYGNMVYDIIILLSVVAPT